MSSRVLRRRSATAAWIYAAVACGILGTVVAARVLGLEEFGVFATALAAVGFFQILLDLTVEESLTKYGFRYVAAQDWGRLRRLFRQMLLLKVLGGALATLILIAVAPFADEIFDADGVEQALLAAALLPLLQSSENVGATALLLHSRYDLRGVYQAGSSGLRLLAIVIAAPMGVTEALVAIVIAQTISTVVISLVGVAALRRFPSAPARELGEDVRGIRSFVIQSSIATGVISLRTTLVPLILGVVAGPTQVGLFRIAQTPQTGLAAASSPARLMLLTEQTRDWEKGERTRVLGGVRSYTRWAGAVMVVAVPHLLRRDAVARTGRLRLGVRRCGHGRARGAAVGGSPFCARMDESLPVTIGRPRLRIVTHGLQTLVAIPLVAVLGAEWGATGAAVAVLASTLVFAGAWLVVITRLRAEVRAARHSEGTALQS